MNITLTTPDDWHVHLRDGDALSAVLPHTAAQFARAIVMPNLKPPVTTTVDALAKLKPAFSKDGTITAGNAPYPADYKKPIAFFSDPLYFTTSNTHADFSWALAGNSDPN